MSYELKWLMFNVIFVGLMWLPYVLNRITVRGLVTAMGNPSANDRPHSPWAERAIKAHSNAVENMVLFAPAVIAIHVLGISTPVTRAAVVAYFAARVAHYLIYVFGIPVLRTIAFAICIFSTLALAFTALGWLG